jgi:hypothetical protein
MFTRLGFAHPALGLAAFLVSLGVYSNALAIPYIPPLSGVINEPASIPPNGVLAVGTTDQQLGTLVTTGTLLSVSSASGEELSGTASQFNVPLGALAMQTISVWTPSAPFEVGEYTATGEGSLNGTGTSSFSVLESSADSTMLALEFGSVTLTGAQVPAAAVPCGTRFGISAEMIPVDLVTHYKTLPQLTHELRTDAGPEVLGQFLFRVYRPDGPAQTFVPLPFLDGVRSGAGLFEAPMDSYCVAAEAVSLITQQVFALDPVCVPDDGRDWEVSTPATSEQLDLGLLACPTPPEEYLPRYCALMRERNLANATCDTFTDEELDAALENPVTPDPMPLGAPTEPSADDPAQDGGEVAPESLPPGPPFVPPADAEADATEPAPNVEQPAQLGEPDADAEPVGVANGEGAPPATQAGCSIGARAELGRAAWLFLFLLALLGRRLQQRHFGARILATARRSRKEYTARSMMSRFAGCSVWLALGALGCAGKSSDAIQDRGTDDRSDGGVVGSEGNEGDDDEPTSEPAPAAPAEPEPEPEPGVGVSEPSDVPPAPVPQPEPTVTPPTPVVVVPGGEGVEPCAGLCGNGAVDSCEICTEGSLFGTPLPAPQVPLRDVSFRVAPGGQLPPSCVTQTEPCDGSVATTCEEIGFTSGTLECGELCVFDHGACESCGTDERIVACRDDVSSSRGPRMLALAATETAAALVWTDPEAGVYFRVFDEALEPLGEEIQLFPPALRVAVATVPGGWVVAADEIRFVLDASGALLSESVVPGSSPVFAASREGGTPLLVTIQTPENAALATLLADDGTPVWETEITVSPTEPDYGSATAVPGGFLVALRGTNGVEVWHLDERDGSSTSAGLPGTSATEYPQLASNGSTAAIVWADFSSTPSVYWAPLDATGTRSAEAVLVGAAPDYFNRSPILMDGSETIVLFGGYTGGTGVGAVHRFRRIDDSGATIAGDYPLQNDPNGVLWPQLAKMGDRVVAAWIGQGEQGRIGLATLTP